MRVNISSRWTVGAGLALVLSLMVAACSNTVSFRSPEEPGPTGFEGDWVGTFQESEMVLRIGDFGTTSQATGSVIWNTIEWDLLCTATITPETSELECDVIPNEEVAFCGDPDPFVDIDNAEPRSRIDASVGGLIREGVGNPCDGDVLVSWEPGSGVVFSPG